MRQRSIIPVIAFTLAFASCILGAWAWFNTDLGRSDSQLSTNNSQSRLWLQARTNIEGYTYIPESVSDAVKEALGTTNIVSGTFVQIVDETKDQRLKTKDSEVSGPWSLVSGPPRITVFLATWSAESKKPLLMLGHTPDICWTYSGWKPVNLGQPGQVTINLPTLTNNHQLSTPNHFLVPFSCRAFESSDRKGRELAVWCTLIDGQPLADSMKSGKQPIQTLEHDAQVRMNILDRLFQAARQRLPVRGKKQFVRYSIPIDGDWEATLERIEVVVPIQLQSALRTDVFL